MARRGTTAKIDLAELEKLSGMQSTDEEIAAWFGVTTRTIERRRKSPAFAEAMQRGKAKGRLSIRRMQLKLLEAGNATMGVWLGKPYLGQRDEFHHDINGPMIHIVCPAANQGSVAEPDFSSVTIDIAPSRSGDLPALPPGKPSQGD